MHEDARATTQELMTSVAEPDAAAVTLSALSFNYLLADGTELPVVETLSLRISRGEFVVLVGPSGCGKTTLLRLISGLETPRAGTIRLAGPNAENSPRVAHVFQDATLLPWRNVYDNVRLALELLGQPTPRGAVESHLDAVGLTPFAGAFPDELSGGMRSRVALARALATHPSVLLLDEPFGALDELTAETLCSELHRLWRRSGLTVLMVTHNLEHAVFLATTILVATPRPLRLIADFTLPSVDRDQRFMRSALFVEQLVRVRNAFRDGLDERRE
jgi:NitT/TauT family transport system ATP-binding protein